MKELFERVYHENLWGNKESRSGGGSDELNTQSLVNELRPLLDRHAIRSLFDCPCGDWAWMQRVDLEGIRYIGGDIVPAIIAANTAMHSGPEISFIEFDITNDAIPDVDAILIRDCFIHFTFASINKALDNIRGSQVQFILTTHDANPDRLHTDGSALYRPANREFAEDYIHATGADYGHRPICFNMPPFSWPAPLDFIREPTWSAQGGDRMLALWRTSDLFGIR